MENLNLFTVLSLIVLAIYLYLKRRYTYWQRKGLDYIEPEFYYGNVRKMAKGELASSEQFKEIYKELKSRGLRHGGLYVFFRPVYMPVDTEIIKCIMQKDFDHFRNHGLYVNEESDPLSGHLFNLEDAKWKFLRVKLTPTFTSGKMKMMFNTLAECSNGLQDLLNEHATIQDPVDIKDILARFTTDVISSCAFGLDTNSLKNPENEFRQNGLKIFKSTFISRMKRNISLLFPRHILVKVGFKSTNSEVESFFLNVVKKTVGYREKNNISRKDFLQLLIELKNSGEVSEGDTIKSKGKTGNHLTMNELTAQCFVFFIAGFETSSTAMSFALYEMATNQDIQEKLRKEITSVLEKHNNKVTYDSIMEMSYLDKIVQESLRKYPPATGTIRICNTAYTIPGTNVVIEPGTLVQIPIIGLHHDPEYYPEPTKFDPERFNEENKATRPAFSYLPFGEGPRVCIGSRFGLMQTKVGLVSVIRHFKVTLNKKTVTPLKVDKKSPILGAEGGIWLNVMKINE